MIRRWSGRRRSGRRAARRAPEADGAGEGGRGAAQHGDADGDRGPGQDDVLARAAGEVVAERERVELADGEEHDDEADHEEGQHGDDEVEAAPADRPDLPERKSRRTACSTSRPDDQLASPAVTAAPARVRRRASRRRRRVPRGRARRRPRAPRRPWPTRRPVSDPTPNTAIATTTASAAPALTPSSPGSASGLRVSPCIAAPRPRARRPRGSRPPFERGAASMMPRSATVSPCPVSTDDLPERPTWIPGDRRDALPRAGRGGLR